MTTSASQESAAHDTPQTSDPAAPVKKKKGITLAEARYPLWEEIANGITHGLGAALSIAALVLMVVYAGLNGGAIEIVAGAIFGATLIMLYSASAVYHSFSWTRHSKTLELLDHCGIYLLIAGSYTPYVLLGIPPAWGWPLFGLVWTMAIIGVAFKLIAGPDRFIGISTISYLAMGWIGAIAAWPMVNHTPEGALWFVLAGGLSYTFGVIFYLWRRLPFSHAIWHLFVLGGSVCHFFGVFFYLIP